MRDVKIETRLEAGVRGVQVLGVRVGAGHDALKVSSLRDVRSKPFLGILNSFMDGRISRASPTLPDCCVLMLSAHAVWLRLVAEGRVKVQWPLAEEPMIH